MKKLITFLIAAALLLCGCGEEPPQTASELDLWVTSQENAESYQALAEKWNAEYPEQQIQLNTSVYSSQSIASKFSRDFSVGTSYNGDNVPDLVELDYSTFPEYVFQQTADLYPLQNMLTQNACSVSGLTLYSKSGICFALPYRGQQLVLCYRLDLEGQFPGFHRKASSFEGLMAMGKKYAESTDIPILWVDYLGSETFLALYVQALEELEDPEQAYAAAVAYLEEAQTSGASGYLPSGDAYAETFPELMSQGEVPCLVTTQANLLRLAQLDPQIPQRYGVLPLPSFEGSNCRVEVPAVAVAIHMSGGDPILSRDFLEYCRFSDAAREYPLFFLGTDGEPIPELSDFYQTKGNFDAAEGTRPFTAAEVSQYLSDYSRQVLGTETP